MKRILPFLLIPVFYVTGPNLVGWETIIFTDMRDPAIHKGQTVAIYDTDHLRHEGTLVGTTDEGELEITNPTTLCTVVDCFASEVQTFVKLKKIAFVLVNGGGSK